MFRSVAFALLFSSAVFAQTVAQPCCGPITPEGEKLVAFLDGLHVDRLWLPHEIVAWQTGETMASAEEREPPTHCSTFAAAVAERLHIYMLRPPQHSQMRLSAAQEEYFLSAQGRRDGWTRVATEADAQALANRGELVVLVYGPPKGAGHIALVRPSLKSEAELLADGPETIQAGGRNFEDGTAKESFLLHRGAWPEKVLMFAHPVKFSPAVAAVGDIFKAQKPANR